MRRSRRDEQDISSFERPLAVQLEARASTCEERESGVGMGDGPAHPAGGVASALMADDDQSAAGAVTSGGVSVGHATLYHMKLAWSSIPRADRVEDRLDPRGAHAGLVGGQTDRAGKYQLAGVRLRIRRTVGQGHIAQCAVRLRDRCTRLAEPKLRADKRLAKTGWEAGIRAETGERSETVEA